MDGFGAALGRSIAGMLVLALVAGGLLALAIEWIATWVLGHLVVMWQ